MNFSEMPGYIRRPLLVMCGIAVLAGETYLQNKYLPPKSFVPYGRKITYGFIQTAEVREDSVYHAAPHVDYYMRDFDHDAKPDVKKIVDSTGFRILIKKGYEKQFGISVVDSL